MKFPSYQLPLALASGQISKYLIGFSRKISAKAGIILFRYPPALAGGNLNSLIANQCLDKARSRAKRTMSFPSLAYQ
jgi:hypothetical protein